MFSKKVQSIVFLSITMFLLSLSTSARAFTRLTARPLTAAPVNVNVNNRSGAGVVTPRPFFTKLFSDMMGIQIDEQEQILKVAKTPNAVILDVRSEDEIIQDGALDTQGKVQWYQVNCSPMDCPLLNVAATNMIPDKNTPIVIHCASGKRATKAKEILQNQGYSNVVNAGGFGSLGYLQETLNEM